MLYIILFLLCIHYWPKLLIIIHPKLRVFHHQQLLMLFPNLRCGQGSVGMASLLDYFLQCQLVWFEIQVDRRAGVWNPLKIHSFTCVEVLLAVGWDLSPAISSGKLLGLLTAYCLGSKS